MTTIVSRLFADMTTAEQAVTALKLQNHPDGNITLIAAADGAHGAMLEAGVPEDSADAYAAAMGPGNAVVVVRAPVTPFGAARNAIDTMNEFDSLDAGVANENYYVTTDAQDDLLMDLKVDRTHRYWATWGYERKRGRVSDAFGMPTVYHGTKFFGNFLTGHLHKRQYWGSFILPPLSKRGTKDSVYHGTKYFGSFLVPPVTRR